MRIREVTVTALLIVAVVFVACQRRVSEDASHALARLDTVLSELGGRPTAALSRGQRWRMISSIGAGLPPSDYKPADLPDPLSRGAGLLQLYCVQCHWLPAPQMHTAAEWPVLVRRMVMRARTLEKRLGGPLTDQMVGDILMAGLQNAELPTPADIDTLASYLEDNSLPAARPGDYPEAPGAELTMERCSICHELPSPSAHTAAGWEAVVHRMRSNMAAMDVPMIDAEESGEIVRYFKAHAVR